jgi:CRISPR/Cas system CSM-associated protein Csm2 small subunit
MANPTKYTADILQEIFTKVESNEKTIEQFSVFLKVSEGSINNYFQAKKKYDSGLEVCAQNVSIPVFTEWAQKYGKAGEPKFKKESGDRKHVKKSPEQLKLPLPAAESEKQEQDADQKPVLRPALKQVDNIPVSELSAKDKKELAMYAIDQHYFFLKQLTGVI